MTPDLAKLLEEALKLAAEDRAALAASLLESLEDVEVQEGVESAWSEEIAKRIHELDSGAVTPIPWPEVRGRILGQ